MLSTMKGSRGIHDTKIDDKPCNHALEGYAGTYTHTGYGEISIALPSKATHHMDYHGHISSLQYFYLFF
ncbi:hypothetical protein J32TS2_36120 [Shouchella clausii]|nr:hypothetical protein J1TS1_36540 [Shouchella clausii]GIN18256.1 hypothetical protein J32TS2_36120 [Shouchella clausii]